MGREYGTKSVCGGSSCCEHGRLRYRCKECGGSGLCKEHERRRELSKECHPFQGLMDEVARMRLAVAALTVQFDLHCQGRSSRLIDTDAVLL
jgi:hypothetical protein